MTQRRLKWPARGDELRRARRYGALMRGGLLAAVAAGPVALLAVLAMPRAVPVPEPAAAEEVAVKEEPADADPSGFAELVVGLWLGGVEQESALRRLAPGLEPVAEAELADVQDVSAVLSESAGGGQWAVTVAARIRAGEETEVRFFTVPISWSHEALTVEAAPTPVAGPDGSVADSQAGHSVASDDALRETVAGFAAAYLTGAGEVDRYVAPGSSFPAVRGYTSAEVQQLTSDVSPSDAADGDSVDAAAEISALDEDGVRWSLAMSLSLSERDGRWEITGINQFPWSSATVEEEEE